MLEATGELTFAVLVRPKCRPGPITMKRRLIHGRNSQSRPTVFWPDLHRLRLRQGQGPSGAGPGMDELLPAVCFAARAAVRDPVEESIYEPEQSAVPDCHHARHCHRLRARDARRAADGAAAVA